MPSVRIDELEFHFREAGSGIPFVFQHGLGGDVNQPFGLFTPPEGFRLLAFDCRGHGQTQPLGDKRKISLTSFADDLLALLDKWSLRQVIVGGISMGAAVALNFALRFHNRVLGLVLSRPAWLVSPGPANVRRYGLIAELIRQHGAGEGREVFRHSAEYRDVLQESPDSAASLLRQFDHPRAEETFGTLERLLHDTPLQDMTELKAIRVPTLVLANRQDPIHPFEYGEILARAIPGAEFGELTPKSTSPAAHAADVQRSISDFLQRRFGN